MAIGRILGETLEILTTGAFAGIMVKWIPKIWEAIKGGMTHPVVEEWTKTKLSPKGLDDESVFSFILANADMKNKKIQFIQVMDKLEGADKKNKTKYVQNFRLIVAIDEIGRGSITIEKKDKDGKVVEVKNIPDPKYVRPGISILESLATECSTDKEMRLFIIATGAMQEAPFGTMNELMNWTSKTACPWIYAKYIVLSDTVISTCKSGENYYLEREIAMDAFAMIPWWKKTIDPRNWWKMINF